MPPAMTLARQMARVVVTALLIVLAFAAMGRGQDFPATGTAVPALAGFDRMMTTVLAKWRVPGGALAVTKDSRLVLARGYGTADVEANQPVQPDSLFRIASISKTVTGAAVLRLVEDGRLNLGAKAFALLDLKPAAGATVDPRTADITIRHLLHHSGGWDRDRSGDPMFRPLSRQAAQALKAAEPTSCETIIRFMLGRPLDFAPGTAYAYSNLGYCVLGRIIEKVSGQSYEEFVQANVLGPAGISRMRIGRTLLDGRAPGEVKYYIYPGGPMASESVFPSVTGPVPWPYGGFHLEAMDSHGGWIASVLDIVRLATALDGSRSTIFKNRETFRRGRPSSTHDRRITMDSLPSWTEPCGRRHEPSRRGRPTTCSVPTRDSTREADRGMES